MIITLSGKPGSGKSTVAKLLAKKLDLDHHSLGDFMRQLAKERNVSLIELSKQAETDKSIDEEIDNKQREIGKNKNNFVIDSRLATLFIPQATHKIFLDAQINIRAARILKDKREEENALDLQETIKNTQRREVSEIRRYREYYNYNPYNTSQFNILIDTSHITAEEVVEHILKKIAL